MPSKIKNALILNCKKECKLEPDSIEREKEEVLNYIPAIRQKLC